MLRNPYLALALGALAVILLALAGARINGPALTRALSAEAQKALAQMDDKTPVKAIFRSSGGSPSRHPLLTGGEGVNQATRDRIAKTVAALPGIGGIRWSDGNALAENVSEAAMHPRHCQDDVEALLDARTIRFEESSARIDRTSATLIDEVAAALRPCLGSIIGITGHTDSSGPEDANLRLSRKRANAVRDELIKRGIPSDGLRAEGLGSSEPMDDLPPGDPANRRIDFSVVATQPISPTPVDTPGPR
ncbi:OmpA family protein [Altericroceibacterium endophyticum]|uniref:OmpA family protein n=1 Tax=Altericroceibacterium endophyticum TaxID=1808508 RepID=A0A6I4T4K4_9SPHN|nr:OmpA family protein [Altericroceibacterium endophyticum]MXO64993.1 OmpA family protein [Altericroceibacterium endophyticum]